jgi:hypothetical protein
MFRATMGPSSGETTVRTQLFLDTWYLLFCVDYCLVCTLHTRQSSTQNNKYKVSQKHNCFSWWWAHSRPKHVEIDKYANNKLCTNLVLFTRLYRDARSTEHKIKTDLHYTAWVRLFWIHMALVRGSWWNAVKFLICRWTLNKHCSATWN